MIPLYKRVLRNLRPACIAQKSGTLEILAHTGVMAGYIGNSVFLAGFSKNVQTRIIIKKLGLPAEPISAKRYLGEGVVHL